MRRSTFRYGAVDIRDIGFHGTGPMASQIGSFTSGGDGGVGTNGRPVRLAVNWIYSPVVGWYRVPDSLPDGPASFEPTPTGRDGSSHVVGTYDFNVRAGAPLDQTLVAPYKSRELTVDEIIAEYPVLPVVVRGQQGAGYVSFDIGALRRSMSRDRLRSTWARSIPDSASHGEGGAELAT